MFIHDYTYLSNIFSAGLLLVSEYFYSVVLVLYTLLGKES